MVVLVAGRGSRLSPLSDSTHKSLLPLNGKPALGRIIEAALRAGISDIVLVVGYRANDIRDYVFSHFPSAAVTVVSNTHWQTDVNIYSAHLGSQALRHQDAGYFIVEGDLALEEHAWETVFGASDHSDSAWVTKGRYSPSLTGGCVLADRSCRVQEIAYEPEFTPSKLGWQKLLGILWVSPNQVNEERRLRARAVSVSLAQYYLEVWRLNLESLPCIVLDLGDKFAVSFNDGQSYLTANRKLGIVESSGALP